MVNKTQMLKGILEGCVLKIISEKPCYSAEIAEALKNYGFEETSEGTLFPMLLRLEKEGLFDTEKISNPLGPNRKYYRLNAWGTAELQRFIEVWRGFSGIIDNILVGNCEIR